MNQTKAAREVLLATGLIAFGLIVLPLIVYLVGQQVVGAYPDGVGSLYAAIGDALIAGNGFAWILILSPYFCLQLLRFWFWLRPRRQTVN